MNTAGSALVAAIDFYRAGAIGRRAFINCCAILIRVEPALAWPLYEAAT